MLGAFQYLAPRPGLEPNSPKYFKASDLGWCELIFSRPSTKPKDPSLGNPSLEAQMQKAPRSGAF